MKPVPVKVLEMGKYYTLGLGYSVYGPMEAHNSVTLISYHKSAEGNCLRIDRAGRDDFFECDEQGTLLELEQGVKPMSKIQLGSYYFNMIGAIVGPIVSNDDHITSKYYPYRGYFNHKLDNGSILNGYETFDNEGKIPATSYHHIWNLNVDLECDKNGLAKGSHKYHSESFSHHDRTKCQCDIKQLLWQGHDKGCPEGGEK